MAGLFQYSFHTTCTQSTSTVQCYPSRKKQGNHRRNVRDALQDSPAVKLVNHVLKDKESSEELSNFRNIVTLIATTKVKRDADYSH